MWGKAGAASLDGCGRDGRLLCGTAATGLGVLQCHKVFFCPPVLSPACISLNGAVRSSGMGVGREGWGEPLLLQA